MAIRWIQYSRVSMQRAGMIVLAANSGAARHPTNLERAGRRLTEIIHRIVKVPDEQRDAVEEYLNSLRLWRRYPDRKVDAVQIQDLWLADPALPSATGAVTPEVVEDIPQLAASLRFLRDENFTQTDRAKALSLTLTADRETARASQASSMDENPLRVLPQTRLLLLHALLEADGDFITTAYETTGVLGTAEFTRADFSSNLNRTCREVAKRFTKELRDGSGRTTLRRLEEWASEIDKPRQSGAKWGGGRPPEQLATLRLEPLVDLGLVERVDRFIYRYRLNDPQRVFFETMIEINDTSRFLEAKLIDTWLRSQGHAGDRLPQEEIWPWINDSYELMKSPLGVASITEMLLLAINRLIASGSNCYFEIKDGIDTIMDRRRQAPGRFRLGMNRRGSLSYMKLVPERAK